MTSGLPGGTENGPLPAYRDLPPAPAGGRSAWGLFGLQDSLGLLNLLTPERIAGAAGLIRTGELFALNAPVDVPAPPLFNRRPVAHQLLPLPAGYDDRLDMFYPQASSQWDALAHVAYQMPDKFYNGATKADIESKRRNTIDHWARRGIAGRAVLLDIEFVLGRAGVGFNPASARAVTVEELESARRAAAVEFRTGDILLLHTGYLAWHRAQPADTRQRLADADPIEAVGLECSEKMAAYLWDAHCVAVASDNPALEVWPPRAVDAGPLDFLHRILIGQFGMALGELWWLEDLVRACQADGRFEMFFASAPLHVPGGVGSPANALAIK